MKPTTDSARASAGLPAQDRPGVHAPHIVFATLDVFATMGGMQRYNRRMLRALEELAVRGEHRVTVLALRDEKRPADLSPAVDFRAYGYSRRRFVMDLVRNAAKGPTLVWLGLINFLPLAALIRGLSPRSLIWLTVHGVEVWNQPPYRRRQPSDRFLLRRCVDRILAVSAFTCDRMRRAFDLETVPFTILPNATEAPTLPAPPWEKPPGPKQVLAVTRLATTEREKNIDQLIDALHQLRGDGPVFSCTIVGDGPLRDEYQMKVDRLGLESLVALPGRVGDEELDALFRAATVFVLPSKKEGFGIVFLEAWKAGIPVIGGNKDAAAEVIEDGVDGILVDPDDAGAIAGALRRLLRDEDTARAFGAAGFAKVAAHYTDARFNERVVHLLEQATRPNAPP